MAKGKKKKLSAGVKTFRFVAIAWAMASAYTITLLIGQDILAVKITVGILTVCVTSVVYWFVQGAKFPNIDN